MKTGLLSLITSLHLNRLCTFLITQSRAASLSSAAGLYFISLRLALPRCLPSFHPSHLFIFVVVVVVILAVVSRRARLHIALLSCGIALEGKEGGPEPEHAEKLKRFKEIKEIKKLKKLKKLVITLKYEMSNWVCGWMAYYMFCSKNLISFLLCLLKKKNLHVQHVPRLFAELWKYKQSHSTMFIYLVSIGFKSAEYNTLQILSKGPCKSPSPCDLPIV